MENQNIIIFLNKIKKLIDLGNTPKTTNKIDTLIIQLEHYLKKKQGMVIAPLIIPEINEISKPVSFSLDNYKKINEIISFINKRFS